MIGKKTQIEAHISTLSRGGDLLTLLKLKLLYQEFFIKLVVEKFLEKEADSFLILKKF